ncbi:DUF334 domain-containing protein, partial [Staphylococcus aureus]|nr:DUF334 domain-containing protein [Staphylococcus aureus]
MKEQQDLREKELQAIKSSLKKTTVDFQGRGKKVHNDFVRLLQKNLNRVNAEDIEIEVRNDVYGVREDIHSMLREVKQSH